MDALGGPPGLDTGYSFYFVPAFVMGQVQFCYAEGTFDSKMGQGMWNGKLAKRQDALVVSWRPRDQLGNVPATAASVGYTPEEVLVPGVGVQGRHWILISDVNDEVRIAHEVGHVLGLLHEHQRSDPSALAAAVPPDEARRRLRDDYAFCAKYNFPGPAYVRGADQPGPIDGDPAEGPLDFDWDSIMIYPSDALTDTAACRADLEKCPLKRKAGIDVVSGKKKFEFVLRRGRPSGRDAEFVRRYYGFVEG
ncbi:hypothetical protein BU23DRAFT_566136 [Bimuria novae-zelandiae CBS 107.79]|uniref:Peptidase M12A domain-containing protein n=1 Tax=Bimuria novae-zelandiae CBS 107.79 TaxID=1447943 RepID=A0A6A5VFT4_9PLEO|nr:hypothetical protein BU23DRAFT_566136 [Bimuria novae-zelandiae CBS 107.79]